MLNSFLIKCSRKRFTIVIQKLTQLTTANINTICQSSLSSCKSQNSRVQWGTATQFTPAFMPKQCYFVTLQQNPEEDYEANFPQQLLKSLSFEKLDDLAKELNAATNAETLLHIVEVNFPKLQQQHYVQSVLLLWTFKRTDAAAVYSIDQIDIDKRLYLLCDGLQQFIQNLNADELAACYLYLRKIGLPINHAVMEQLLVQALLLIKTEDNIPLTALSHLSVAIKSNAAFHTPLICKDFMPHIENHINHCASAEQARLIAICLRKLQPLVQTDLLQAFKTRVQYLCQTNVINSSHGKTLLKLLQMFNMPAWSLSNTVIIRELMLLLKNEFLNMSFNELSLRDICHMFHYHKEPAALVSTLSQAACMEFQKEATPETLVTYLPFAPPHRREPQVAQLRQMINNAAHWSLPHSDVHFFNALRELKVADVQLCDAYWLHIASELPENGKCSDEQLLHHCHHYMNFNNNLGGTYRCIALEEKLSKLCMHAIVYEMPGIIPWKFARLAAFIMGYGHTPNSWKKFPNLLLSKILTMSPQFSASDCYVLSRGMQIALELRFRFEVPSTMRLQLATIDTILANCAERYLYGNQKLKIGELNAIVHAMSNRKALKNTVVYHETLKQYKEIDYQTLNSRTVREICFNFNASNFLIPEALESLFSYVTAQHEHVLGDTIEKVLFCAYNLGYTPKSLEVFDYAAQILLRDFEHMRGLSLLKSCMALCFYKALPEELINAIFCVDFIQRIEDEIRMCYSRATYPEHVQNMVMQLNRTVCLDFPQSNVPWFQQNYIEAQMSKKTTSNSPFVHEIKNLLFDIIKPKEYVRCNHVTPYGYQIDFVIHFNHDKQLIPPEPVETTMLDRITKVAILLLKLDSFSVNDLSTLRGADSMKIKHLEMLGYKVLHVNEHDWYSKYMQAPNAKKNYLKCLLQISS